MKTYTEHLNVHTTPQSAPIPGREPEMKKNLAGGYVFEVDKWTALRRFLILGTEGGTYYASERDHTVQAGATLRACVAEDGVRVVEQILEISLGGLAPKQDAGIFALAFCSKEGNEATRRRANDVMPQVCRTGYALFLFMGAVSALGTITSGTQRALDAWYNGRKPDALAYQLTKYRGREGWTHRDVLRLGHIKPKTKVHERLFGWAVNDFGAWTRRYTNDPEQVFGYLAAKEETSAYGVAALVREHRLGREMVPTEFLNDVKVQEALFEHMPMTAMIRNLGNLSKSGLLKPMSDTETEVVKRLGNQEIIYKARVHPFSLLIAMKTYAQGHGMRGRGEWSICPRVVDALDGAIELAWANVEPTHKRYMIGIDVSGSMRGSWFGYGESRSPVMPSEAAAMVALTVARKEPMYDIKGFDHSYRDLGFTAKDTFRVALQRTASRTFGTTDCSQPMLYALENEIMADVFLVLTDNETWSGRIQPTQALKKYRREMNPEARLAVAAFTATDCSIADPKDAGMLDIVGLDASLPVILSAFARGEV
jgi:60 kDa SS-A/Ro ribonucleoprotein